MNAHFRQPTIYGYPGGTQNKTKCWQLVCLQWNCPLHSSVYPPFLYQPAYSERRENTALQAKEFQLHAQLGKMTYKQVLLNMKLFCISDTGIECHRKSWVGTSSSPSPDIRELVQCQAARTAREWKNIPIKGDQRAGFGQTSEGWEERKQIIHLSCSQLLSSLII